MVWLKKCYLCFKEFVFFFDVADLVLLRCWNMGHVLGYVVLGMTKKRSEETGTFFSLAE